MPQPGLVKRQKETARDDKSVLYEKEPGVWITTCPGCGKEHDISFEFIMSENMPECCGWNFRLFKVDLKNITKSEFDPRWEK